MKCIKIVSLLLVIVLFSCACSENGISPNRPDDKTEPNVGNRKTNIISSSQDSIRYDDLPDLAEFVIDGREWDHTNLTYYFSNGTADIAGDQEQQALKDAMDYWADVTPLTFSEVSEASQADIIILWATGAHGDGSPFDGINGVLAHAFYPPPNGGSYAGDVHFDDAENWTLSTRSNSNQPIDLTTVAAHELGHSLGLGHSKDQDALMYAFYSESHRYLSQDDIDGIQNIYGASSPPPPPPALNASLSGPRNLLGNQIGTWTTSASGGTGSYSYSWKYRQRCVDQPTPCTWSNWLSLSETSSQLSRSFGNAQNESRQIDLSVVVNSGSQSESDNILIHVVYATGGSRPQSLSEDSTQSSGK